MKVVILDSNIWVSGLHFAKNSGTPAQALDKANNEDMIATCDEADAEVLRVLREKFGWNPQLARAALKLMLRRSTRVALRGTVKICRDPKDDMFLECALRAKADLLITGDKDLLVLGSFEGTRIVTAAQYVSGEC